jgi:hypothetical protein
MKRLKLLPLIHLINIVSLCYFAADAPHVMRPLTFVAFSLYLWTVVLAILHWASVDIGLLLGTRYLSHEQMGYMSFVFVCILAFYRWIPPLYIYLSILILFLNPSDFFFGIQRQYFLRSLIRTSFSGFLSPVYFSDVLLGDVLTSFSRVLGDIQVVAAMMYISAGYSPEEAEIRHVAIHKAQDLTDLFHISIHFLIW